MTELTLNEGLSLISRRAKMALLASYAYIAVSPLTILVSLGELLGWLDTSFEAEGASVTVEAIVLSVSLLAMIASGIVVSMWIYRAHANLRDAGYEMSISPGWSVGWFFVPVANLFKPLEAMRDLWTTSAADDFGDVGPSDGLLRTWWGAWIAGNIISNAALRTPTSGADAVKLAALANIVSDVALTISALCLIKIISAVTAAQRSTIGATVTFS